MGLSVKETQHFYCCLKELLRHEQVIEMKKYIQHGNTTTYTHCILVAYYSYKTALRLNRKLDTTSIIRGAMLHDFYLYDWHVQDKSHRLHGFFHPRFALKNARRYFKLNQIEEDIILNHMWPLTLNRIPLHREAYIVLAVDKFISLAETLYLPVTPKAIYRLLKA